MALRTSSQPGRVTPETVSHRDACPLGENGPVSAYVMVERVELKDPELFRQYLDRVSSTIESHGGRYHVVTGEAEVLEGEWRPNDLVVFSFPSREQAIAWWKSDEYAPLKRLRREAAVDNIVLVEGL